MLRLIPLVTFLIASLFAGSTVDAQIILNFSRAADGGVRVVGQGSGNTTGSASGTQWQILDFDNNFISDTLGFGYIDADSVQGSLTNAAGRSRQLNRFSVGRSNGSNDDVRFRTQGNISFGLNQPYTFTMEAIFNVSTLAYDDLIAGTYYDQATNDSSEIFGQTSLDIASVTEPRSLGLLLASFGLAGFVFLRRKRNDKDLSQETTTKS